MRFVVIARMIAALACGAAAMNCAAAGATPTIHVVASFSILGDMVRQVAGGAASVRDIVGPDGDSHVYEPTPADAAAVAKADLVVVNGLGFDRWMERLVDSARYKGPIVVATRGINPIPVAPPAGGTVRSVQQLMADPHAFQSLPNALIYVKAIADGLCQADAGDCASYRANAERYSAAINALDADIRSQIAGIPAERRRVISNHTAFGYFGAAYGIEFLAPQGVDTEAEPSPASLASIIRQIKADKASALFLENISDPRLMEEIGRDTGLRPGGKLYSDALAASGPASTYLGMMQSNAALMVEAMAAPPH